MRCNGKSHAWGDSVDSRMPKRTIIFGNAFQYEPSTGDLSTTEEFGGILIGQLDKFLSRAEVQAAIRELGSTVRQGLLTNCMSLSYKPRPGQVRDLSEKHWRGNSKCHKQREQLTDPTLPLKD